MPRASMRVSPRWVLRLRSGRRGPARWVCPPRHSGSSLTGRRPLRSNAWPESAVAVLAACSLEAAWITLLYITVTALATHAAGPLSLLTFALAALAGLLMSRRIGADPRDRDRTLLAAVAVA